MTQLTPFTMVTVKPNPKLGYPFTQRQMTLKQAWDVIKGKPEHWFTLIAHEYHYMGTKRKKISSQKITYKDVFNNA